jgi:hypothetical protein
MPEEERLTIQGIDRCRSHLGEDRGDALFAEGKAMGVDRVYAWALEEMVDQTT